jgi:hypothetical protein
LGKALILAVVAIGVGVLVYWLAGPRPVAPAKTPAIEKSTPVPASNTMSPVNAESSGSRKPDVDPSPAPIPPPRTPQQRESDATEARRAEFYDRLRRDAGNAFVTFRPAEEDAATLDIKAGQDDPANISPLINLVLRDNAYFYGFRHIRFYAPNPPQMVERYRLAAEANADAQGNWQTFQK